MHIRQVPEEQVDGDAQARVPIGRSHRQVAITHRQVVRGRDDVDGVLLDISRFGHLQHRHRSDILNDPVDDAVVIR
ncbi:hypothetical protein D3C76_1261420 [compost metagenome]